MMIHLSDEENALCEKLRRAETQKEIDEIIAKLKEVRKKNGNPLKNSPFA